MLRDALLVFSVLGPLVGEINPDLVVFVEWTNTQDFGVRSLDILGNNVANTESVVVSRGIPNCLRVKDDAVGVDDVSIIALKVFRSALLKNQEVRRLAYSVVR
jgi:hypothetical protein